jgi:hypothetical protein
LTENRDGEAPLMPLLRDILAREADLIGDQRDKILWYTFCLADLCTCAGEIPRFLLTAC